MRDQSKHFAAALFPVVGQCFAAAGGIDRHCTQQIPKLGCAAAVESAMRPPGESRKRGKGFCRNRISAILKEKDRHRQDAEFAGELGQGIRVLFHAVAHKDQRTDGALLAARLLKRMFQQPADLGLSCCTAYRGHALLQNICLGCPGRCLEFAETAVVGKLDFDPAHGRGGFKHLRLDMTGPVP